MVAAVVLIASVRAAPADASLVYVRGSQGDPLEGQVIAARNDGSHLRVIAYGASPVVSPDGRSVAYFRRQGGATSLRLVPIRGGRTRLLLRQSYPMPTGPAVAWSPGSRRLVAGDGGSPGAYIVDITTGRRVIVPLDFQLDGASFSPDGRSIVLNNAGLHTDSLLLVRTDGSAARTIANSGLAPLWGRAGIVYTGPGIALIARPGARPRTLYSNVRADILTVSPSADGESYLARARFGRPSLYQPLVLRPRAHVVKLLGPTLAEVDALSQDGRVVLGESSGNIVTVDLAGHMRTLVTAAHNPSWTG